MNKLSARQVIESTKTSKDAFGRIIEEKSRLSVKSVILLRYIGESSSVRVKTDGGGVEVSNVIEKGEIREFCPTDAREALMVRVDGLPQWEYAEGSEVVWGQASPKPIGVGDITAPDFDMASFIKEAGELGIIDKIKGTERTEDLIEMIRSARENAGDQGSSSKK